MNQYFSLLTQAIFLSFISNFPKKHCDHYALQKINTSGNVIYKIASRNFVWSRECETINIIQAFKGT